jgi:AraC family transcriptional regulator
MRADSATSFSCDAPGAPHPSLELLQSSTAAGWPGVVVLHYRAPAGAAAVALPRTPYPSVVLELPAGPGGSSPFPSCRLPLRGEISCIPAGEPAPFACRPRSRYVQVQILTPLWNGVVGEVAANPTARMSLRAVCRTKDALLEEILLQLLAELQSAGRGSRLYVESLSKTLVVHLARQYAACPSAPSAPPEVLPAYKLKKVQAYIGEKLFEKITLGDLSALAGFSTFHFARLFKATTGLAPYQYILKLRMEQSQRLLLETDLPVVQIGLEVGIENPSRFSSFFKQYTGLTPTAYRRAAG